MIHGQMADAIGLIQDLTLALLDEGRVVYITHFKGGEMPERPDCLETSTHKMRTGCGIAYITVTDADVAYHEIRGLLGKTGGCAAAWFYALTEVITEALNAGVSRVRIEELLSGIRCPHDGPLDTSCPEAVARVLGGGRDGKN